jgi:transcriptional accessory protein Tex/SPT6
MAAKSKAAKTTARKAGKAAVDARENPYVQRLIEDPELRDNVRAAVDHARQAYKRLSNGKAPAKALIEDRKLHKELHAAGASLHEARAQLRGKRKKHRGRKLMMLAVLGAAAFLVANEGARKALLDRIFGAEEEFEYTSTTTP